MNTKFLETPTKCRSGSRTTGTSKVELFVIIVNGFQPLTIIIKSFTLDVAAVLDPPLKCWTITDVDKVRLIVNLKQHKHVVFRY